MKKFNIMLIAGAAMISFAACDDAPETAIPQENQQPPMLTAADIEISTTGDIAAGALDLAPLVNDRQDSVALLSIDRCDNLAEGYSLVPVVQISGTDDFASKASISCHVRGTTAYAAISDINSAYATVFGYHNTPEKVYARVLATTEYEGSEGTAVSVVGSDTQFYAPSQFTLTPDLMLNLYVPMGANDFDIAKAQALQTNDGVNYWGYVNVTSEFYFSNGRQGELMRRWDSGGEVLSGNPIGIRIDATGCVWIAYNISSGAISSTAITTYGVIGDLPGNNWGTSVPLTQTTDPLVWKGDVTFGTGQWKFRANDGWDINLGGDKANLLPGGDNIDSPGAGTYTVTLDLSKVPYSTTLVKK